MEVVTGKGVFAQLGLDPLRIRYPFLLAFLFLFVGGLLGGYVVIENPPDVSKAPPNAGAGLPRDPFDSKSKDPETMTTYTRGGIVERPSGQVLIFCIFYVVDVCKYFDVLQKGREPYASDLDVEDN